MENILEKEPVKRVQEFINQFNPQLKVLVLETTARKIGRASCRERV